MAAGIGEISRAPAPALLVAVAALVLSVLPGVPTPADATPVAAAPCTISGTPGDDVLRGGRGDDVICARGGDDVLKGRGGSDVLRGGAGTDLLSGGNGRDELRGRNGRDELEGGSGRDLLRAGKRGDRLEGGSGDDEVKGGSGGDSVDAGGGDDLLGGGEGRDTLDGRDAARYRDVLRCGSGGADRALADPDDAVRGSCEDVAQDDPPTNLTLSPASIAENEPAGALVGELAATDADPRDTHEFALVDGAGSTDNGSFSLEGARLLTAAVFDFETDEELEIRVGATDQSGATYEESLTVTVTDVIENDDPVAVDDTFSTREDTRLVLPVTGAGGPAGNDTDPDDDELTVTEVSDATGGTASIVGEDIHFSPGADGCGAGFGGFEYTVSDDSGRTDTGRVAIDVDCVDDAPRAVNDSSSVAEDAPATPVDVLANDSDRDGGSLSVDSTSDPANGTVAITGGGTGLRYEPDPGYCNSGGRADDTFTYSLAPGGSTATVSIAVTCTPDAPVVDAGGGTLTYTQGDPATAIAPALTVTDPDAGAMIAGAAVEITGNFASGEDDLEFSDQNGITGSYDSGTGVLTLTGTAGLADYQAALRSVEYRNVSSAPSTRDRAVTFMVTDDTARDGSDTRDIEVIAVDTAPTAVNDRAILDEDVAATAIDVLANDTDPDGGSISVDSTSDPANGTVAITGGGTGLRYEPDPDYCNSGGRADDTFTYSLAPGGSTATVSVTVACLPDAPTAVDDSPTLLEDALATTIDVLGNDTDADGDPITISTASDPANGTVVLTGGGAGAHTGLTYEPDADYCNSDTGPADTFTYEVNGGSTATVAVTVTCGAEPPVLTNSAGPTAYTENDPRTVVDNGVTIADPDGVIVTGGSVDITGNFASGEDVLDWTDSDLADGIAEGASTPGTVVLTGEGTATEYAAALAAVTYANISESPSTATRTVTFSATTGVGSTTDTIDLTVAAVNDAPIAVNDTATTDEDTTLNVAAPGVLGNDMDPDGPGGTRTVVQLNGSGTLTGTSVEGGSVTINPDGSYAYTPPTAFQALSTGESNTDSFEYAVEDTAGARSTATVTLTVDGVSDAPTAVADTFAVIGNTGLFVGTSRAGGEAGNEVVGSVLANDTDPDSPAASLVAEPVTDAPTTLGGTITILADGTFTYHPGSGDTGVTDTFTYRVCDAAPCDSATVANSTGTLSLPIAGQVWYVENDVASGGDGTSDTPFDTLVEAEAASGAGDTTYVFAGDDTTVGLDTGYQMEPGERLIGEISGLSLDADGAGSLPREDLHAGTPGADPSLTASGEDVVALDDDNVVRGLQIDPSGTGGGIAGGAGDTGGGTIDDVRILDAGTLGTQPGLELDSTSGTFDISKLTVDGGAVGVRLNNAGTVNFADAGTVSITTTGAAGLDATATDLGPGSFFDDITVSGSGSGGVSMVNTTGTTTFQNVALTTTSGSTPAFRLSNAGDVTVPSAGTATVSATGGPAVDVTGTAGATLSFDDVDSADSASDGINLAGLGSGSFTADANSTITNAGGIAFDLDGGSGAISYEGTIDGDGNQLVRVQNTSGGTKDFNGAITDGAGNGGGILLSGNGGARIRFDGGVTLVTGSSPGFAATGGGTVAVTDPNPVGTAPDNTIATGAATALDISDTLIAGDDVTFRSISSDGAARGILLDTTGTSGSLLVTGNGGTCTNADPSGCSGGTIANGVGGDDSGAAPSGTGIVLVDTDAPSLTRMRIHDHSNYGIRGTDVTGFALANSVVNGLNGTNATTPFDDSSVLFTNLTGSATVTDTYVSGGLEDNFRVDNSTGSLDRITFTGVTFGVSGSRPLNDALLLKTSSTAGQLHATVTGSTFSSAAGDLLQLNHNGGGTGDLDLTDSTFSNAHPSIATGGGGLSLFQGGTSGGDTSMTIDNNSFRDAVGPGVLIVKSIGPATQTGTFTNNTIGVSGVANSGSAEGSALKLQLVDRGSSSWTVTDNRIFGYNNHGIEVLAGGGASAQTGTINTTITGNTITQPGNTAGTSTIPKQGIHYNIGTVPGDTFQACAVIGGAGALANDIAASGVDGNPPTGVDQDVRLRQRQSTTIRLPGYTGAVDDDTAVQTFVNANNSPGTSTIATNTVPTGGGYVGTGSTCP